MYRVAVYSDACLQIAHPRLAARNAKSSSDPTEKEGTVNVLVISYELKLGKMSASNSGRQTFSIVCCVFYQEYA